MAFIAFWIVLNCFIFLNKKQNVAIPNDTSATNQKSEPPAEYEPTIPNVAINPTAQNPQYASVNFVAIFLLSIKVLIPCPIIYKSVVFHRVCVFILFTTVSNNRIAPK